MVKSATTLDDGKLYVDGVVVDAPGILVLRSIGRGANGEVFEAIDQELARRVALKIWTRTSAPGIERARFEARKLAQAPHPLIVTMHNFRVSGVVPYAIMEFVDSTTMQSWIEASPGDGKRFAAWRLYEQAMAHLHSLGLVHGDGHTKNVLMLAKPTLADMQLHGAIGLSVGLKLADPGTSLLWSDPREFRRRDANVLIETADRLLPEAGMRDMLDTATANDSKTILKGLGDLVDFLWHERQISSPKDDYGIRHNLMGMATRIAQSPVFHLQAVLARVENLQLDEGYMSCFRQTLVGVIDTEAHGGPSSMSVADGGPAIAEARYAWWKDEWARRRLSSPLSISS